MKSIVYTRALALLIAGALPVAFVPVLAFAADVDTSTYISICGNAVADLGEVCDQGYSNNVGGYGSTTAERKCEAGCMHWGPYCGDGILQVRFTEQCDDGNASSGDLCSDTCRTEPAVPNSPSGAPPRGSIPSNPIATQGTIPGETLTKVILRGKAYPLSSVRVLADGKEIGVTQADANADFLFSTTKVTPGTVTFGFVSQDASGVTSITTSVVFEVVQSAITTVANIFFPPTLVVSKKQAGVGELLTLSGVSIPFAGISTEITDDKKHKTTFAATTTGTGAWAFQFDTSTYKEGSYFAKAFFKKDTVRSGFGRSIGFIIGNGTLPSHLIGDINVDGKVNLTDFSIFLVDWGTDSARADFNADNAVNLADFSIMLFNWTG